MNYSIKETAPVFFLVVYASVVLGVIIRDQTIPVLTGEAPGFVYITSVVFTIIGVLIFIIIISVALYSLYYSKPEISISFLVFLLILAIERYSGFYESIENIQLRLAFGAVIAFIPAISIYLYMCRE